jgi:predicted CoA-binding protein
MSGKKTLVLGATTNPGRYAYLAAMRLAHAGHPIVNVGLKTGQVAGKNIEGIDHVYRDIDTITLYVGPKNQPYYYDYILQTNPKRIIFNPGTENTMLEIMAQERGIETIHACTLVLLSTRQY